MKRSSVIPSIQIGPHQIDAFKIIQSRMNIPYMEFIESCQDANVALRLHKYHLFSVLGLTIERVTTDIGSRLSDSSKLRAISRSGNLSAIVTITEPNEYGADSMPDPQATMAYLLDTAAVRLERQPIQR